MPNLRKIARILGLALVLLLPAVAAGAASPPRPPAQASAAFKAVAFNALPRPAYVEVKLLDDAPENVQLAWEVHHALEKKGLLAGNGPVLRLALETESAALIGDPPQQGGQWQEAERPKLMGILRAVLTDTRTGARLWEAEAVYETIWGDLGGGALKLVPTLVDAIGRSVERQAITLR